MAWYSVDKRERWLLLCKVYVDDSGINQPPVSVLAGWIASVEKWAAFRKEWDLVLRMKPHISYFKYVEAVHFNGQFNGISSESRDEKLKLLAGLIADFDLLGVLAVIPYDVFHRHFGKPCSGALKVHYPILFVRLMARVQRHFLEIGENVPKVDFIFDQQLDQEDEASKGWDDFRKNGPDNVRSLINSPPPFLDDKQLAPLQAADLQAGWARQLYSAALEGQELPQPAWTKKISKNTVLTWIMDDDVAIDIAARLNAF